MGFYAGFRELIYNVDLIVGMVLVPFCHKFIAGLADEFAVDDGAAKGAGHVQTVVHGGVGAEGDGEVAFQIDAGREGAETIHFDGAACTAKLYDLVADFLDGLIHGAFYKAGGSGDGPNQFGLLNSVTLFNSGTIGIDCLNARCHGY